MPRFSSIIRYQFLKKALIILFICALASTVLEAKKRPQPDISDIAWALRSADYRAVDFTFIFYIFDVIRICAGNSLELLHHALDNLLTSFLNVVLPSCIFASWKRRK